ncbi:T-complex protein 1, theta subunit [Paracoccidioides brasiliensis]|nr:T-complex protein 1, theta subunit [Paracoccidioides brasiliensis]
MSCGRGSGRAVTILSRSLFRQSPSVRTTICTGNLKKVFVGDTRANLATWSLRRWLSSAPTSPATPALALISTAGSNPAPLPIPATHSRQLCVCSHAFSSPRERSLNTLRHSLDRQRTGPAVPAYFYRSSTHHPLNSDTFLRFQTHADLQRPLQQQHCRPFSQWHGQQQQRRHGEGGYTYRTFDGRGGYGQGYGGGGGGGGGRRWWMYYQLMNFWEQHRLVIICGGSVIVVFYAWNLEVVPMTGRLRFNCISNEFEMRYGKQAYEMVVQEYHGRLLPNSHPLVRYVDSVFRQLILTSHPQLGKGDEMLKRLNWKVHVIDSPEMNAFVLPGGNVFVFTGILPICRDRDGLAAILGHEIAHVLAHHMAERLSSKIVVVIATVVVSKLFEVSENLMSTIFNLILSLPNSRVQELEADQIGLMMMAKGCFKPEAAAALWSRMQQAEKRAPMHILSTHPSSGTRMKAIQELLPEADLAYDDSGCGVTGRYGRSFKHPPLEASRIDSGDKKFQHPQPATQQQHLFSISALCIRDTSPSPTRRPTRKRSTSIHVVVNSQCPKCWAVQTGLYKYRNIQPANCPPPSQNSHDAEDGAVLRNIEACRSIAQTVQTSLGPNGRNKIIINHLQKLTLTSDAATILRELEVVHPAAKLVVMASQQQEAEMGDATNLVIVLTGELLKKAEELLRMGLKTSDIVLGYEKAQGLALKCLDDLEVDRLKELRSTSELSKAVRTVIGSKQSGSEDILAPLVAEAVLTVLPKNPANFNVDNVRVVKIMGGSLDQSRVVKGMVFGREPDGTIKKANKAKVGVFSCPIDISQTETKGTVLLHNAQEMLDYTKGEEARLEATIKELYDSGIRVVVAGSTVGELAMHYLNRFNILVIKILSKFELRRLCRVVGATPLARLGAPMPDEMGSIDVVETLEVGGDRVTVFRQEDAGAVTRTATIVLRGATQNHLDDVERAIDDGVNVIKAVTKDPRLVPGAGATELQLVERVSSIADKTPGLPQYAIRKYAEAFEVIPRTLAESAGLDATEVLSHLYTAHQQRRSAGGNKKQQAVNHAVGEEVEEVEEEEDEDEEEEVEEEEESENASLSEDEEPYWTTGVDLQASSATGTIDAVEEGILDLLASKAWAIRLATEAARTVLSVDQIIVARQAGGPKPPGQNPNWDED